MGEYDVSTEGTNDGCTVGVNVDSLVELAIFSFVGNTVGETEPKSASKYLFDEHEVAVSPSVMSLVLTDPELPELPSNEEIDVAVACIIAARMADLSSDASY